MARVYVSTWEKYNNGSLQGEWVDLEKFINTTLDFLETCKEIHKDEPDPEFMYQDSEGIPKEFINESNIDERVWEYLCLDTEEQEVWAKYLEYMDSDATWEQVQDSFRGKYETKLEYIDELVEQSGVLERMGERWKNYFDYEQFLYECEQDDVYFCEVKRGGWFYYLVFSR